MSSPGALGEIPASCLVAEFIGAFLFQFIGGGCDANSVSTGRDRFCIYPPVPSLCPNAGAYASVTCRPWDSGDRKRAGVRSAHVRDGRHLGRAPESSNIHRLRSNRPVSSAEACCSPRSYQLANGCSSFTAHLLMLDPSLHRLGKRRYIFYCVAQVHLLALLLLHSPPSSIPPAFL